MTTEWGVHEEAVPCSTWMPWFDCILRKEYPGVKSNNKTMAHVYTEWNARVVKEVEEERVLVFNVKQGWGPLVTFLGMQVSSFGYLK
jgi:hypothetical protein